MAGVAMPSKQADDGVSKLLTLGGAAVGGIATGSPSGAMMGAQAGGMMGGMMGKPSAGPAPLEPSQNAMSRRMQQLDQSGLKELRDGINSLQYVQDDKMKQALAKPLLQADAVAKSRGY